MKIIIKKDDEIQQIIETDADLDLSVLRGAKFFDQEGEEMKFKRAVIRSGDLVIENSPIAARGK
jgi:hypothetical protein